jgi:DnaJ family protein C protein 19
MPYLLLVVGVLIGIYALMKFFSKANPEQVVNLLQAVFAIGLLGGCLFLALTGRIGPAIAIAGALIPMFVHFMFKKRRDALGGDAENPPPDNQSLSGISSRQEALDILGLEGNVSDEEIDSAYKTLMKKLHPDQGGSDYLAQKLSAARDFLLK